MFEGATKSYCSDHRGDISTQNRFSQRELVANSICEWGFYPQFTLTDTLRKPGTGKKTMNNKKNPSVF